MGSFYDVLGVPPSASPQAVRTAFKRRALVVHPDKGGSKEDFQKVLVAFEVLSDFHLRSRYDISQSAPALRAKSAPACAPKRPRRYDAARAKRHCAEASTERATAHAAASAQPRNSFPRIAKPNAQASVPPTAKPWAWTSAQTPAQPSVDTSTPSAAQPSARPPNQSPEKPSAQLPTPVTARTAAASAGVQARNATGTRVRASKAVAPRKRTAAASAASASPAAGASGPRVSSYRAPSETSRRPWAAVQRARQGNAGKAARRRDLKDPMAVAFALLQGLPSIRRRQVLTSLFTEAQRRALEVWATSAGRSGARGRRSEAAGDADMVAGDIELFDDAVDSRASENLRAIEAQDGAVDLVVNATDASEEYDSSSEAADSDVVEPIAICDWGGVSSPICTRSGHHAENEHRAVADGVFESVSEHRTSNGPGVAARMEEDPTLVVSLPFRCELAHDVDHANGNMQMGLRGSRPQGIINVYGRSSWYRAAVTLGNLRFSSRKVTDLLLALDFHVVLTALKQRLAPAYSSDGSGNDFVTALRREVPAVLEEHTTTTETIGLCYCVDIHIKCWFGSNTKKLERHTPFCNDLEHVIRSWLSLNRFTWHRKWIQRGLRKDRLLGAWMHGLHNEWPDFRNAYIDIMEEFGSCRAACAARFDTLDSAAMPHREGTIERWNREAMTAEEKRQRCRALRSTPASVHYVAPETDGFAASRRCSPLEARRVMAAGKKKATDCCAAAAEERQQESAAAAERRLEVAAMRAMAREDRGSARWRVHERRRCCVEDSAIKRIRRLLACWERRRRGSS